MWESMGKVQDTISRIAKRHRANATQSIALIVPTQQQPTEQSFPTSYTAVAEWLATQAAAPYQTQLIGLTRALQHSNRLKNSATERLKITTLLETQVNAMAGRLKTQFINSDLPYSNAENQAFESYTTLLAELAYGYKIALIDALLRRSGLHRLDRIHATYFAMRHLAEYGLRYSQSYLKWPARCWRDINTLYWLAEQEGAVDDTVKRAASENNIFAPTIRELYTSIAMFHLSRGDQLNALHMDKLIEELSANAAKVSVHKVQPSTDVSMLYSVAINSAGAPALNRYCNYANEDQIRYLDLSPVADTLKKNQSPRTNEYELSRLQRQKIIHIWSHQRQRRSPRKITTDPVAIQTGIKDCHALLQSEEFVSQNNSNLRIINRSEHGLGLRCSNLADNCINIGELIACQQQARGGLLTYRQYRATGYL